MVDEGKPGWDEVRSEFTPPLGVELPPEPEPEGSAFTQPKQPAQLTYPAFTPPNGIPLVSLSKETPWPDRMRAMLRMPVTERPAPEQPVAEPADAGPPVPRVLDLILRIGELLLAGGEGAEDVEAAMLGVAHAYGLARVEPTVTFTLLGVSYQPSLIDPPVTANRTVRRRGTDYTRLAAVFRLVDDITTAGLTLEDAYRRLGVIRRNRHPYPSRVLTGAAGLLAGAASMMVGGGGPVVFAIAAIGAMLGDRLAWLCAGRGLPEFYQFTAAAMPAAVLGILVDRFGHALPWTSTIQASAVITGGLFALIPGRALVAAVQDGLTGFYITASARLLEVMYLFTGIVVGVTLVLYAGVSLGAELDPEQSLSTYENAPVQLVAAMVLSLAFAMMLQCERQVLLLATLNGGVAWVVYGVLHQDLGWSAVPATAVAAGLVGLLGQLLARHRHASALPYVTAAIGPLLPGSATYFGLLGLTQHHLTEGLTSLTKAAALALAVAIGVNLGSEAARMFLKAPGAAAPAKRRAAKRTRGF
ncbi:threonine/serine ThrE exporter family protein [Streptomyces sp. NBC_01262]|uniref:threonine/serine ThrE exporter family protein n=1 Tax=Streptomyces sp. NBC_01262 TaxID=2903803 RepID=UPI002E30573B|nr:threonine/serine exporter family protein [Streptomyces sp. NBC_01262]